MSIRREKCTISLPPQTAIYYYTFASDCADCISAIAPKTDPDTIPGCWSSAANRASNSSCSVSGLFRIFSSVKRFRAEMGGQFRITTVSLMRRPRGRKRGQRALGTRHVKVDVRSCSSCIRYFLLRSILYTYKGIRLRDDRA